MNMRELVIKNRSCRGYDESRPVTREELTEYVDLARQTASSVNLQPLKYYIAWKKEEVEHILSMTKWARALPKLNLPYEGKHPTGFIIINLDQKIVQKADRFMRDIGIVAQTILLAATEDGLGGCMIGNFKPEQVKEELHLPENLQPLLIVAIGKPAEEIHLVEVGEDGRTAYYRDPSGQIHYVPKRKLEDVLLCAEDL